VRLTRDPRNGSGRLPGAIFLGRRVAGIHVFLAQPHLLNLSKGRRGWPGHIAREDGRKRPVVPAMTR
jgi:hypothetical protein